MKLFLTKFIDFVRVDGKIFVRVSVNSHFASDRAVVIKVSLWCLIPYLWRTLYLTNSISTQCTHINQYLIVRSLKVWFGKKIGTSWNFAGSFYGVSGTPKNFCPCFPLARFEKTPPFGWGPLEIWEKLILWQIRHVIHHSKSISIPYWYLALVRPKS